MNENYEVNYRNKTVVWLDLKDGRGRPFIGLKPWKEKKGTFLEKSDGIFT